MSYLDNGTIRLGVDLEKGGTITYLANSSSGTNVVNSFDLGREVQQSYFAGPWNFGSPAPPWANFPWNAIGAGDRYGNPSRVIAHVNDGRSIYTKTIPMQWALNNVPCECEIEHWISLDGRAVRVHNRFVNNRTDRTIYPALPQELPAVYTNGPYWRLFTYSGTEPFTDAPLREIPIAPPPNWAQLFDASEHWAALVDASGFGLGVFNPATTQMHGGFAGVPGAGGPHDDPTGYLSPTLLEVLDWNIRYEYDYALILGTLEQIRAYAVANRPDNRPDYRFTLDRQHFHFANFVDGGWPIRGHLRVPLDKDDPYLIGPIQYWKAEDVPRLYITAAYHSGSGSAQIFWRVAGEDFSAERSVRFEAIADGKMRTYSVDLSASSAYRGTIAGIRFDPSDGNEPNAHVDVVAISFRPDALNTVDVIEYYHPGFNHYFITSIQQEIEVLGKAPLDDWYITGSRFLAHKASSPPLAAVDVCRFFNDRFGGVSTHFYAPKGLGCEATLAGFPDWTLESSKLFVASLPEDDGSCAPGSTPVFRIYNNGMGGAPNHRFTTDARVRLQMIENGHVPEGVGMGVGWCGP